MEGPSQSVTTEIITKAMVSMGLGKAADPSGIFAKMLKPVGEAGSAEVHVLVEAIIFEPLPTGRRSILSASTRTNEPCHVISNNVAF